MAQLNPLLGTPSWAPQAAGVRRYGGAASSAATTGRVDPTGYQDRERRNALKKQIYLRWMQDRSVGRNASPNALRKG